MINQLSYTTSFPSTGKVFKQSLNFKPGLTVIKGANETGKSLIIEMIRYALFGVQALRGDRSDYDTLDVDLTFTIKDSLYRVIRTGSKATLNGNLAVGTAAVNKEIVNILGFNLDVFDVACAAMQGDLDKLTKRMQPAARRKMVEEVVGLEKIEEEEKNCRSQGNSLKKAVETITDRLVKPEEPTLPNDYKPSEELEKRYLELLSMDAERNQLLKIAKPEEPTTPIKPEFSDDVDAYETRRVEISNERRLQERTLQQIPRVTRTRQDILNARRFYDQQALGARPSHTESQLLAWEKDWEILEGIGTLVQCPSCGVEFDPSTATIHDLPQEPPLSLREITREIKAHAKWSGYNDPIVESTDLTLEETKEQEYALSQESYRNQVSNTLAALPDLPSRAEEAERKRVYLQDLEVYNRTFPLYKQQMDNWMAAQQRIADLKYVESLEEVSESLKNSRLYEEQKRKYDADVLTYQTAKAEADGIREKSEGYFKASDALRDVRLEAKQHLVPSLSKVASHLLNEMTEGKRSKVYVDENFEVSVDGQPVRTLSGSGVSVVNLALRVALGQVLTQKVVPLFLADEVDHDMDKERAEATHRSLRELTKMLDKVIVVTHKDIEGDNVINLE